MSVNQGPFQLFLDALRSDRFTQGTGTLISNPGTPEAKHCCLAVACIVAEENGVVVPYRDEGGERWYLDESNYTFAEDLPSEAFFLNGTLPLSVREFYGFDDGDPELNLEKVIETYRLNRGELGMRVTDTIAATEANDELGLNFTQIADAFEATYGEQES